MLLLTRMGIQSSGSSPVNKSEFCSMVSICQKKKEQMVKQGFRKEKDEYIFCIDREIYRTKELAFCFDEDCGTIFKLFGDYDRVSSYAESVRNSLMGSKFSEDLVVVSSIEWDIETINRFVECSGSILKWWKNKKLPREDSNLGHNG